MITSYITAVDEVMNLNGTKVPDWTACPVVETEDGPLVTYPQGYNHGQSPYSGGVDTCCEICGHKIRRVYGIQCDRLQLTLCVGSECVTHFADGANGEQVARQQALVKAKVRAEICAAWMEEMYRLSGMHGWITTRPMIFDLLDSYRKVQCKGSWYLRRLRADSGLHRLLARALRIKIKWEAKGQSLHIPEVLLSELDKLEGAVTV